MQSVVISQHTWHIQEVDIKKDSTPVSMSSPQKPHPILFLRKIRLSKKTIKDNLILVHHYVALGNILYHKFVFNVYSRA